MSDTHDPPLRQGHRGNALRGLDWVIISGPISEDFALRIASLCFLGPAMDHGDGAACYRRRPEIARQTRRRTLVTQRHREGGDAPAPDHVRSIANEVDPTGNGRATVGVTWSTHAIPAPSTR